MISRLRLSALAFQLLLVTTLIMLGGSSRAQTVQFVGAQSTVPTGTLNYAYGVAVDAKGNVYVANSGLGKILKETRSGGSYVESTIGSGLFFPAAIAIDQSGNLYIADTDNNRAVKETLSGGSYIQTVIATGLNVPYGIAVDGNGNVYIADSGNNRILKETPVGSSYSQSTLLTGYFVTGISVDASGNLYMTAAHDKLVLKATLSGGSYTVSTVASGIGDPSGIAVDSSGIVFVADVDTNSQGRVLEELPSAGGGYTQNVIYSDSIGPLGLAVDAYDTLYVTNIYSNQVLQIKLAGANFGTVNVATRSASTSLTFMFNSSGSIAVPSVVAQGGAGLDFLDAGTGSCTTNGTDYAYADGATCTVDVIFNPQSAGARYGAVVLHDGSGNVLATGYVQGTGVGPQVGFLPGVLRTVASSTVLHTPSGVAVDASGNVYIADQQHTRVAKETPMATGYSDSTIVSGFAPSSVAVGGDGSVYILGNGRVVKETPLGSGYTESVVVNNRFLAGMTVDGAGNVYVTDYEYSRVLKEAPTASGYIESTIPTSGLLDPFGIAVDNSGNLYIADPNNLRIVKETLSPGGTYSQSNLPVSNLTTQAYQVAVDGLGNVYISDAGYNAVYKLAPSLGTYTQTTVLAAGLDFPYGLAVDGNGNLYVSDSHNNRVVEENYASAPVLHFAATTVGQTSSDSPQTIVIANNGNAAMNLPVPNSGYNPSSPSGFTIDDNASSACPVISASYISAGTLAAGFTCGLTISFSPQSSDNTSGWLTYTYDAPNETIPSYLTASIPLIVVNAQLAPSITWQSPSSIRYGTALSGVQLNASANVAGTFSYSPALGSILTVGPHTLSVTFTPTDTTDFKTVSSGVALVVTSAPMAVLVNSQSMSYGSTLPGFTGTVAGAVPGDGITAAYSTTATSTSQPGNYSIDATLNDPNSKLSNYSVTVTPGTLTITKAMPPITWATPGSIPYGTALSSLQLNASSTIAGTFSYSPAAGSVLQAGSQTLQVTFTPTNTTNYTTASASVTLQVNKATPAITWATPAAIAWGTALSATQLNATSPVAGSFSYSPAAGTVLEVGFPTLSVTFTPTDTTNYSTATATVSQQVNKIPAPITWATPAPITYGTVLSAAQLNATSPDGGLITYSPDFNTVVDAGARTLTALIRNPTSPHYATGSAQVTLQVNKATPRISWNTPDAIVYGTALSATQLHALATPPWDLLTDVNGTFTYTPALGTVLNAGTQTLSVTFTPVNTAFKNDGNNYTSVTATTTIVVDKATQTITWNPAAITYGTALGSAQLNASTSVAGSFSYTPAAGTVLNAGPQTLSVTFTPADTANYGTATSTATLIVNKAALTLAVADATRIFGAANPTFSGTISGAVNGDALAESFSTLANATSTVGSYAIVPSASGAKISNYTVNATSGTLTVTKATPAITWANPANIGYGTVLSSTQLNAAASVPGTFTYTPALGTVLNIGAQTLSVTFAPTDTTNYTAATATVSLFVTKAAPAFIWIPATITYGTALGSAQLNASTSIAGSFSYTPAAGTVLGAGPQTLSATFTPTDLTNYSPTTTTAALTVNKAPLTITVTNAARVFGAANPSFIGTIAGTVNGDALTESFSTSANAASIVGNYTIVPSVSGANVGNYSVSATNGMLTISQAGTATTFALSNNNLTFTANVSSLTTGSPTGTVTFYEGQTAVGTATLSGSTATYTVPSFPTGNITLSAQYSGDANFTQSAAPPILELAVTPVSSSLSISKSGTATNSLGITVPSGYIGSVQFSCTGLPQYATCSFSPPSLSFTGSTSTINVTVTITTGTSASLVEPTQPTNSSRLPILAVLFMPGLLGIALARRRLGWNTRLHRLLLLLLLAGVSTAMTACGGVSSSSSSGTTTGNQTPAGSSNVQVVASGSGGLSQSTSFSLTVQ